MIQCEECEAFRRGPDGTPELTCDPFASMREPECLAKWQVFQLTVIARAHQATLDMYRRLAPLQEKMIRHVEREIDDADDADRWKEGLDEEDEDDPFRV